MRCHLTIACANEASTKVFVNDQRTGFAEKTLPACADCAEGNEKIVQEFHQWRKKMAAEGRLQ